MTPDPNTSAKVSRYEWEPYLDTNWCLWARLPPQILAFFGKDKFDMFNISAI